jgi:hypothetical protein
MLMVQHCSNLVISLVMEDAEVRLNALQTVTQQFQACELGHCHFGKLLHC